MVDIQNLAGERDVPLGKVGVNGIRDPIKVMDKAFITQRIMATVDAVSSPVFTLFIPEVEK